ncbi:MAG: hypothetical protein WC091_20455 [Sulfuricellaceae bacterium]
MNKLRKLEDHLLNIASGPEKETFRKLVRALCFKESFDLAALYDLNYVNFELAIDVMKSWRLDRYTKTKERLKELAGVHSDE